MARRNIAPLAVRFDVTPHPTGRDFLRLLKRWRAGDETPRATHMGDEITPDRVDWDRVPASYHTLSGPSGPSQSARERAARGRPSRMFALPQETDQQIDTLAERLGCSRSAVVVRAVAELAERSR